jgi:MFS family permease
VYFFADIPAALSVKKFGFITLPLSCIAFGVVTLGTAFIHNEASFYAIRILLGITESVQFPGLSYVVSRYYRRTEVTTRVSFFMLVAAGLAGGFGGLLASGLLALGKIADGVDSWRNIFFVEGCVVSPLRFDESPPLKDNTDDNFTESSQSAWESYRCTCSPQIHLKLGSSAKTRERWPWPASTVTSLQSPNTKKKPPGN